MVKRYLLFVIAGALFFGALEHQYNYATGSAGTSMLEQHYNTLIGFFTSGSIALFLGFYLQSKNLIQSLIKTIAILVAMLIIWYFSIFAIAFMFI